MDDIIDALGGPTKVATELGLKQPRVANWKARGVPWRWRQRLAHMAAQRGIAVPPNFLDGAVA